MLFSRTNEAVQGHQLASFVCWSEPCSLLSECQLSNGSPWVQEWREGLDGLANQHRPVMAAQCLRSCLSQLTGIYLFYLFVCSLMP